MSEQQRPDGSRTTEFLRSNTAPFWLAREGDAVFVPVHLDDADLRSITTTHVAPVKPRVVSVSEGFYVGRAINFLNTLKIARSQLLEWLGTTNFHRLVNTYINRHLHSHLHDHPFHERFRLWHWNRLAYNNTPVFWLLKHVWWIPGLQWLWRLRCVNVRWRMEHHRRRVVAKEAPDLYDWSRV